MNEAGFSLSLKVVNDKGAEQLLTFRGEHATDWPAVQSSARECVIEMMKTGWHLPELRALPAQQKPDSKPAAATATATNGNGENTFRATKLKVEFSPDGKKKGKLFGGKFEKFGVTVWPEVLSTFGFDIDQMQPGEYQFDAVVTYALNDKNQPSKVTGRAA